MRNFKKYIARGFIHRICDHEKLIGNFKREFLAYEKFSQKAYIFWISWKISNKKFVFLKKGEHYLKVKSELIFFFFFFTSNPWKSNENFCCQNLFKKNKRNSYSSNFQPIFIFLFIYFIFVF